MSDKDFGERNILLENIPGVPLLICLFHVSKAFRREVTTEKLGITQEELLSVDALLNILDVSIKVLDKNVNLTRIKRYFSKEAWNHLNKDIISPKKENAVYDCCVCHTDLHSEDCVACDVCLNWYYVRCIGLRLRRKNLLVLPKFLQITLNMINLIHCIYLRCLT